jgi:site-specific DNA-methyltransferase (adenine-specific)
MELRIAHELERIHQGDCLDFLRTLDDGLVDLVFADPPFNIGYEYDEYHDCQDEHEYVVWSAKWMEEVYRILKPNGTFWLAIGDEYAAELKVAAKDLGFKTRSWVIWYYTFGVNCTRKFSRSHVHLFHFVKNEGDYTFNADDPGIRVPSARAIVYADKRANPAGRLPDDTWILRPQDLPEGFRPTDDTWYYARVAGTFSERQGFHGCQMPEQLLGRIIRASSNPGDVVLDPFAGSGTTLAVAKKLRRQWIGCELSQEYVRAATERLNAIQEGDVLDGPANPIASAPSTTNGRKLETFGASKSDQEVESDKPELIARSTTPTDLQVKPERTPTPSSTNTDLRYAIREAIVKAFSATHEGYSTDWLLASPQIQVAFHEACRDTGLIGEPADWNRELLRLRKSGHFPKNGPLKKISFSLPDMDDFRFAAEIAWRLTRGKFPDASLDEIFCDPAKAEFFDRIATRYALRSNTAGCRWAALRLRKASKKLVAEMKKFGFMYETRDFPRRSHRLESIDPSRFAGQPGLYLLQTEEKAPLFVDTTRDLGARLLLHAQCGPVAKTAQFLSIYPPNELPSEYQKGFKVDLVRRNDPRLNVNLAKLVGALAI